MHQQIELFDDPDCVVDDDDSFITTMWGATAMPNRAAHCYRFADTSLCLLVQPIGREPELHRN